MTSRLPLRPTAAAVAMALTPLASQAVTYTVTTIADSGAGSLRDAMTTANGACSSDPTPVINFAIPGTGPFILAPSSPLPTMNCGLGPYSPTIDATTQAGYAANSNAVGFNGTFGIVLSGAGLSSPGCGLQYNDPSFYGGALTVKGLDVKNWSYAGIGQALCGTLQLYGNRVTSNNTGIAIGGSTASVVGSASVGDRNVVSDNTAVGITVSYGGTVDIIGNFIGTPDGSSLPGVTQPTGISWGGAGSASHITNNVISGNTTGINLSSDAGVNVTGNMVGANAAGSAALPNAVGLSATSLNGTNITANVFSGNLGNAVSINGVTSVTFSANFVGTDALGNVAIANGSDGMFVTCGAGMTMTSNVFSGNVGNGITIASVDSVDFGGNKVGVASNGSPLANADHGVLLAAGACLQYGSNGIFSTNTIANNGVDGIGLTSAFGVGNNITQNSIYANGNKNININSTVGPLPNDAGDADSGPNNQQNYPVISLVTQSGGNTSVTWTFNSTPSSVFEVEFFENAATGTPAGKTYLGALAPVTTDASGNASGTTSIAGLHDFISMTATGPDSSTSEFSAIVAVTPTPGVTIAPAALNFGNVVVNTTSPSQSSTLTSSGTAPYAITTFDTSSLCYGAPLCYGGPFICSTNCATSPTSYNTGQSCTVTASFSPTVLGPASSTIYICDNAAGSPHTITLSGTAVAPPPLVIVPASQDFGSVAVGTSSAPIAFNVSNPGASPAPISGLATSGPFQIVGTTCGATLAPFASCNTSVTFNPTVLGPASGTFTVTSGRATLSSSLTGTGVQAPQMALPPPIDLGTGILGVTTLTQTVTLTNTGNATLTFSSITVTEPFTLANNCPTDLAPGASCDLVIGIANTTPGTFAGTLTIVSNGGSGTVPLSARVQPVPVPLIKVAPTTVGFGDRVAGTTSAPQRITITNEGGADAALTGFNLSPDFIVVGTTCGTILVPQATCFTDVAMKAIGFGRRIGQLVIGSNASNAPHTVSLAGTGCRPYSASANRFGARANCSP